MIIRKKPPSKRSIFFLPKTYPPPANLHQAELRIENLTIDIIRIEMQLSNPDVRDRYGQRLSSQRYKAWRFHAVMALTLKKRQRTFYKRWVSEKNPLGNGNSKPPSISFTPRGIKLLPLLSLLMDFSPNFIG